MTRGLLFSSQPLRGLPVQYQHFKPQTSSPACSNFTTTQYYFVYHFTLCPHKHKVGYNRLISRPTSVKHKYNRFGQTLPCNHNKNSPSQVAGGRTGQKLKSPLQVAEQSITLQNNTIGIIPQTADNPPNEPLPITTDTHRPHYTLQNNTVGIIHRQQTTILQKMSRFL